MVGTAISVGDLIDLAAVILVMCGFLHVLTSSSAPHARMRNGDDTLSAVGSFDGVDSVSLNKTLERASFQTSVSLNKTLERKRSSAAMKHKRRVKKTGSLLARLVPKSAFRYAEAKERGERGPDEFHEVSVVWCGFGVMCATLVLC